MLFGIPESDEAKLSVLGVRWDGSSSYRRGASKAPACIREATSEEVYNSFSEDLVNLAEEWSYLDLGDVTGNDFKEVVKSIRKRIELYYRGQTFLFLGGDHSITYATFRGLKEVSGGSFGLIYFDAHPDCYESYNGDPYSHACTVRRLVEEGYVRGEDVALVGIRAATKQQVSFAEDTGIKIFRVDDLDELEGIDLEKAYISFDIDVLDPAFAPGCSNPEPGGLSTRELIKAIKKLDLELVAFDIVEVNPNFDCSGVTCFTAAKIIREVLGRFIRH
ncbi:MAG: agmatinase [Candidatus Korarchaeum sp.]|nr:agmatinase [Candidatus Korarchaeum sp.]MDW8035995.1 agmatinase [Candidatus Korarchaeum sp.]